MPKTVLVTGGTGWIASWIIIELLRRGYEIRTSVRSLEREAAVRSRIAACADACGSLSFVAADLARDDDWAEVVRGCDGVIHVASPLGTSGAADRESMVATARDGTLRVLKAAVAAGVPRVVMTSSAQTVSLNADTEHVRESVSDETKWTDIHRRGLDPYPVSKTVAECAAWDFMAKQADGTMLTTILPSAFSARC